MRAICKPGPLARSFINNKEIKINKVEYFKNTKNYKCIVGTIVHKNLKSFLVKTKNGLVKVIEYEFSGKIKVGDRFET